MRKHFLILMLMALLPLAGWATPFSQNARLVVGEITYGDEDDPTMVVIDDATIDDQYWAWDEKFYTDANCTQVAGKTVEETFTAYTTSTVPAGRYFVKVSGKNPFTGTLKNQIIVKKRPITLSFSLDEGETFHKTFGDPDPVLDDDVELTEVIGEGGTQFVNGDDVSSILGDFQLAGAQITYKGTDANKTADGHDFETRVPGYDIQIVGLAEAVENYEITFSQKMDIWQKAFNGTEDNFSVTLAKKTAVYNGDPQAPQYVVKLGDLTVTYDVQFFSNADRTESVEAENVKNAGKYYTKIVGNGNFSGTYFDAEETFSEETAAAGYDFIWQITKRPLTIKALDQEKVYDAKTTVPENEENKGYSIMGRAKAADTFGTITLTASSAKAGARKIIPSGATNDNYEFNYAEGNLNIKKAKLYITAEKATKVYGTNDPAFTFHVEGAVGATYKYTWVDDEGTVHEETKIVGNNFTFDPTADDWNLTWKSTTAPTQNTEELWKMIDQTAAPRNGADNVSGRIKVTRNNTTENDRKLYKGVLVPSWNTNAAVFENYEITPVNGDFDITGGTIIVTALNQSKTYGDADPSWTANENVNYIVSGLAGDDKLSKEPTLTRAEGEDYAVDGYDITVSGAEAPDGYTGITYVNGTFMINKAELHVKALDQKVTLTEGYDATSALAALNLNAFTIDATKKLKNDDAAEDVFEIKLATEDVAAQNIVVPTYNYAGTYKSIIVALTDEDVAKNYELTFTAGNLVIAGNDELIFDRNDQNLVTAFAAANPEEEYDVKFLNNRTLRAGQWNMMVLPFKVTVPQLSAAMKPKATEEEPNPVGYAIVNVLNSATTSSDVRFELTMGAIPANTPFLIKTAADVDLNTITAANVKIDAPTGDEVTGATYNDVVFKGIYATKANLEAGEMTIKTDKKYYGARTGANLRPFEAYLTGVTAGARIFIEDIDENGTTAIKELNVDTMKAYAVDGWYTLNGVKLQAAPTEKGVYINNGKKVVIK